MLTLRIYLAIRKFFIEVRVKVSSKFIERPQIHIPLQRNFYSVFNLYNPIVQISFREARFYCSLLVCLNSSVTTLSFILGVYISIARMLTKFPTLLWIGVPVLYACHSRTYYIIARNLITKRNTIICTKRVCYPFHIYLWYSYITFKIVFLVFLECRKISKRCWLVFWGIVNLRCIQNLVTNCVK